MKTIYERKHLEELNAPADEEEMIEEVLDDKDVLNRLVGWYGKGTLVNGAIVFFRRDKPTIRTP